MSDVAPGSCDRFIEWLFIILAPIFAINLIDVSVIILWSLIMFTIGRIVGRADQIEEEEENEN